ncbi:MAG: hypothetical protein A2046_10935 [Bacteroidetes bacterium GWA2_30_7]|nr:MAG: hypothetical protein A2046_10935 [Bacteroidetes bacterium GWA2_30_7]
MWFLARSFSAVQITGNFIYVGISTNRVEPAKYFLIENPNKIIPITLIVYIVVMFYFWYYLALNAYTR